MQKCWKKEKMGICIKKNENEKKVLTDKFIWKFLQPWLKPNEAIIERKVIYTFKSAIANKWRKGRVFIAGDAAHLMPPLWDKELCWHKRCIKPKLENNSLC